MAPRAPRTPKSKETEVTAATEVTESAEVVETAPVAEAAAEATPTPAAAAAPSAPELTDEQIKEALAPFDAAVTAAVAEAGESGELSAEQTAPVVALYLGLPSVKIKNRARDELDLAVKEGMKASMKDRSLFPAAAAHLALREALREAKPTKANKEPKAPKVVVDPTDAYVSRVMAARLAVGILQATQPEGVSADWSTKVTDLGPSSGEHLTAYQAYLDSEAEDKVAPEVPDYVVNAFKIASGRGVGKGRKAAGGGTVKREYTGPVRDVLAHITEVMSTQAVGAFLKVGVIAKTVSSIYPEGDASPGAVAGRLGNDEKAPAPAALEAFKAAGLEIAKDESGRRGLKKVS